MMKTVAILSVNKYNEDFEHNEAPSEFSGHKWSLQTFWKYLEKEVSILNIFWKRWSINLEGTIWPKNLSTSPSKFCVELFLGLLVFDIIWLITICNLGVIVLHNHHHNQGHDPSKIKTRINNLVIKTILCGHKEMARSFNEKVSVTFYWFWRKSCYTKGICPQIISLSG